MGLPTEFKETRKFTVEIEVEGASDDFDVFSAQRLAVMTSVDGNERSNKFKIINVKHVRQVRTDDLTGR